MRFYFWVTTISPCGPRRQYFYSDKWEKRLSYPADLPVLGELCFSELQKLKEDGLIDWDEKEVVVTTSGRHFIRNMSSAFDLHLQRNKQELKPLFSKAI